MGVGSSLIYAPGLLRRDAGADRAGDRGGQMRRHVYQPYPRRGRPRLIEAIDELIEIAREIGRAGRNLPSQAIRPRQLGQDRRGDRADRGGAGAGPAHHRRHVYLSGELDRLRRGDAALGPGGRHRAWVSG